MINYFHVWQNMNTYKLQKGKEALHLIPAPLKVWSKVGTDLIGPLKESDSYG